MRLSSSWRAAPRRPAPAGRSPTTTLAFELGCASSSSWAAAAARSRHVDGLEAVSVRPTRENVSRSLISRCMRARRRPRTRCTGRPAVELTAVAALQELAEAGDLAQRFLQVVGRDVGELLEVAVGPRQVAGPLVEARGTSWSTTTSGTMRPASPRRPRRARRSPAGRRPGPPGARRPTPRRAPAPRAPRWAGGHPTADPRLRRRGRRRRSRRSRCRPSAGRRPRH